jgi:hypothetical protein
MYLRKFLLGALVAAIGAFAAPSRSEATFMLRLTDTGTGDAVTISDGDGDGVIGFIGSVGGTSNWTINITAARSKPNVGSASAPELRLTTTSETTGGGGTLRIEVSDVDFGPTANPLPLTIISNSADPLTGPTTTDLFLDLANSDFNMVTQVGSGLSGSGVFDVQETANATTDTQFSLNLVTTVTHTGANTSQFDSSVTSVPAPAGLILAATAVPFLGLLRRRMRKPEVTTAA